MLNHITIFELLPVHNSFVYSCAIVPKCGVGNSKSSCAEKAYLVLVHQLANIFEDHQNLVEGNDFSLVTLNLNFPTTSLPLRT